MIGVAQNVAAAQTVVPAAKGLLNINEFILIYYDLDSSIFQRKVAWQMPYMKEFKSMCNS